MNTWNMVALVMYTVILSLPVLYVFDKLWTSQYSMSKDVRITLINDYFRLERKMFFFRKWITVKGTVTARGDKVFDMYNRIQKGEWGKKLIEEPV